MNELVPFLEEEKGTSLSTLCQAGKSFLPRVQLFGGSSTAVKKEQIPMGCWGIVRGKEEIESLGKSFNALVMGFRAFAINYKDDTPIVSYDDTSAIYQDILEKSKKGISSKCMAGPQFLLWLADTREYVTLFCNNATFQREVPKIEEVLKKRAKFVSILIESGGNSWHGPKVTHCQEEFEIPPASELIEVLKDFKNPKENEVLPADAATSRER